MNLRASAVALGALCAVLACVAGSVHEPDPAASDDGSSPSDDEEAKDDRNEGGAGAGAPEVAGRGGSGAQAAGGRGGAAGAGDRPADAGAGGKPVEVVDASAPPRSGETEEAILAVGYGGLRVFSLDGGRTWGRRVVLDPNGGDDKNLIRGAGYGDGVWVAVGWKIFTSEDGASWTEISDDVVPGSWYDCVNYKDDTFVAQATRDGYGAHIVSTDRGKTWKVGSGTARCQSPGRGQARATLVHDGHELKTAFRGKLLFDGALVYTDPCCHIRDFAVGRLPKD